MNNRDKILNFIRSYQAKYGYPPTVNEIAEAVGISSTTVAYWRARLRQEGVITYQSGIPRSTVIVNDPANAR